VLVARGDVLFAKEIGINHSIF